MPQLITITIKKWISWGQHKMKLCIMEECMLWVFPLFEYS